MKNNARYIFLILLTKASFGLQLALFVSNTEFDTCRCGIEDQFGRKKRAPVLYWGILHVNAD